MALAVTVVKTTMATVKWTVHSFGGVAWLLVMSIEGELQKNNYWEQ